MEKIQRGKRLYIESECFVESPATEEITKGPAPYRVLRVTNCQNTIARSLDVWRDRGNRHNIDLVASLRKGDMILVIGPKKPRDAPYYNDSKKNEMRWVQNWKGNLSNDGSRLVVLSNIR